VKLRLDHEKLTPVYTALKMIIELICLVILVIFIYSIYSQYQLTSKYPRGPRPWPLLGNLSLMRSSIFLYLELTKLRENYGDVFTIYLGSYPLVVLNGSAIKEALVEQSIAFASRPSRNDVIQFLKEDELVPELFMLPYGPPWRLFRKLGHQAIKVNFETKISKNFTSLRIWVHVENCQ